LLQQEQHLILNLNKTNGFLLIELLLAISLVACILTLSISSLSFLTCITLRTELEKMRALFLAAHTTALSSGKAQKVYIDLAAQQLIWATRKEALARNTQFGILPGVYGPPSQPIQQLNSSCTFVDNIINFYPDGSATAGSLYLVDENKNYLYALTLPAAASLYIRFYKYTGSSWAQL
jgi:Tfp pilus assembly protein FimT